VVKLGLLPTMYSSEDWTPSLSILTEDFPEICCCNGLLSCSAEAHPHKIAGFMSENGVLTFHSVRDTERFSLSGR